MGTAVSSVRLGITDDARALYALNAIQIKDKLLSGTP